MFLIPRARARQLHLHSSHPDPSEVMSVRRDRLAAEQQLAPLLEPFWPALVRTQVYFPDKRLIQFDCGKLQRLDLLLRTLKGGGHRALIFTQMTRMLDVLESFLNIHGHTYLRLDGATRIEQRQKLTERFNQVCCCCCFFLLLLLLSSFFCPQFLDTFFSLLKKIITPLSPSANVQMNTAI